MSNEEEQLELLRMLLEMSKDPANHLSSVHLDFTDANIEYAFIGGMALRPHNYPRMTEDIDVLISKESVKNLDALIGRGYTLRPGASNNMFLHVSTFRVPIDILVEGQQEGGIDLPNPKSLRQKINGVWYASLPALITLKLQANRSQDLNDVHRLIIANELDKEYIQHLPEAIHKRFLDRFQGPRE